MLRVLLCLMCIAATALPARAQDSLQFGGFALLRGGTPADGVPLDDEPLSAQVQLGIDWRPSLAFRAHVHLLARSDDDESRRHAGIVEAFAEQNVERGEHRLKFMEGAFFLPGSRENVDALWESPYSITSSALNSWLGEELRPIGVDAAYTLRRRWTIGATAFIGNDTFGAFPIDRGWALRDHWALLGERQPTNAEFTTSVSAETDDRIGWAARGRWNNDRATVQLSYIDNRSDAVDHGRLLGWRTKFYIAAADFTAGDWNFIAESGWGTTTVFDFTAPIGATYLLASRRLANGRASMRIEQFRVEGERDYAITVAYFFDMRGKLRAGIEGIATENDSRLSVELRYFF